ncbi:hypothetical protein GGI26_004036 [Coemansia sp. RSA 1358]|nr:hypothetical protein EDC05_003397 [Coemansia umbellata]KAJ2621573.1 hypothetical protein GGI26_004036 [Coemansia sp. RSA 1358]
MTVNEKKRSAEMTTEDDSATAAPATANAQRPWPYQQQQQQHQHPCFWGVLHGESLNFVFVSASLHSFLGNEQASTMLNQSLFDYIHPDEANRARRDLVDTFIAKSILGSGIR